PKKRFEHVESLVVAMELSQTEAGVFRCRARRVDCARAEELDQRTVPSFLFEKRNRCLEVLASLVFLGIGYRRNRGDSRTIRGALRTRTAGDEHERPV